MIGGREGATRESLAGALLSRLAALSVNASKLTVLARKVEDLTIGASPSPNEPGAPEEEPTPSSFIDRADDYLNAICADLAEAHRRLERVDGEFTCPEREVLEPPTMTLASEDPGAKNDTAHC